MKRYLRVYSGVSSSFSIGAGAAVQAAFEAAWDASCKALDESVEEIYQISKETYCPVLTGLLKSTAQNELTTDTSTEHTRVIGYGNDDAHYAGIVHEVPYSHNNPPMAQWKYLEVPARLNESKLISKVQNAARDSVDS